LIQAQPKILAGEWTHLLWLFPLSFYISIRYVMKAMSLCMNYPG